MQSADWDSVPESIQTKFKEAHGLTGDNYLDAADFTARTSGLLDGNITIHRTDTGTVTTGEESYRVDFMDIGSVGNPRIKELYQQIDANQHYRFEDETSFPLLHPNGGGYTITDSPLFDRTNNKATELFIRLGAELAHQHGGNIGWEQSEATLENVTDWLGDDYLDYMDDKDFETFIKYDTQAGGYAAHLRDLRTEVVKTIKETYVNETDRFESEEFINEEWFNLKYDFVEDLDDDILSEVKHPTDY